MAITCSSSSLICFSSESTSRSSSLNLFYSKPNIIIRTHLVFYPRNQKRLNFSVSDKWRNRVSFFSGFSTNRVESLKEELFQAIKPLDRGAEASPEDQARVDQIARKLEAVNDVKEPLKSNLLNGKWELLFTTSQSLLQTKRPKFLRPNGKIYQAINVDTLRAQNLETWPFFNQVALESTSQASDNRFLLDIIIVTSSYKTSPLSKATANLVPLNSRRVAVKFDYFRIGGVIPIKSPGSGRGQLEITYLDKEFRISRGNRENLFILKMVDPSYRVPL